MPKFYIPVLARHRCRFDDLIVERTNRAAGVYCRAGQVALCVGSPPDTGGMPAAAIASPSAGL